MINSQNMLGVYNSEEKSGLSSEKIEYLYKCMDVLAKYSKESPEDAQYNTALAMLKAIGDKYVIWERDL